MNCSRVASGSERLSSAAPDYGASFPPAAATNRSQGPGPPPVFDGSRSRSGLKANGSKECGWCGAPARRTWCSRRCRQSAWRLRQRSSVAARDGKPLSIAYADPPYPGLAWKFYKDAEVDHEALIAKLRQYDGWALSTSQAALRDVLPMCPSGVRVCAWVKPIGASSRTFGLHNTWEPLIVVPGRRLRPGKRDWLSAQPARSNGDLIGRKPIAFCAWLFDVLGMLSGDSLDDLFPGTGIVGRTWSIMSSAGAAEPGKVSEISSDVSEDVGDDRRLGPEERG